MEVHVICCNDSIEYAIIGDIDKANKKMEELKQADWERLKFNLQFKDFKHYSSICYWHIHTVKGE